MSKRVLCFYLCICISSLFYHVALKKVVADTSPKQANVTVTATVPETTVTFSGFAPASSTVTIREGGLVIGTTVTGPDGTFSKTIINTPGIHDFTIYYTDTAGRATPETSISGITLVVHLDTPVNNIHLPPTIALSKNLIYNGEQVAVFGQAAPGSTMHVFLNGAEKFTDVVGGGSDWLFTLSSGYIVGDNLIYAYLTKGGIPDSINSYTVTLTVNSCKRSDLNCDTRVNLADFSILMYYWGGNSTLADINKDGIVGLSDFSIMMFDWTG